MIPCDICGKEFKFPYLLLRHLNGVYSCSPNKFSIENGKVVRKTIENQEKVVTNEEKVVSGQEKVVSGQEKVVPNEGKVVSESQNATNEDKKFQCVSCEKVLRNQYNLNRHEKICKGVHILQCPICLKTFADRSSKSHHIKKVDCSPPGEKEFKCVKCEKVLKSKLGLNRHEKICKGVSSLQCPTCFKSFSDKTSKYKHIKNVKCSPPEDTSEPHKNSVYLLIEREFMITKENIFKIGRSVKVCNRARQYPKGSQLLVVLPCIDSVATECNLKRVFSEKFIHRSDIGSEYYEGPPNAMIKEFVANVALHF